MYNPKKIATVPINKKGIEEVNAMIYETDNSIDFDIPDMEFKTLFNSGIFDEINEKANLLIDDCEEEVIPNNMLPLCNRIINENGVYKNGVFAQAVRAAIDYGTFVDLSF